MSLPIKTKVLNTSLKSAVNMSDFFNLMKKYETMSLKKIDIVWNKTTYGMNAKKAAKILTCFGSYNTCSLCKVVQAHSKYKADSVVGINCEKCAWYALTAHTCSDGDNEKTWARILESKTPEDLVLAFEKRANHMRNVMKKNNI